MPYVNQHNPHMEEIQKLADQLVLQINAAQSYEDTHGGCIDDSGLLNYTVTTLFDRYFRYNTFNYSALNRWLGALQGASFEFYRRIGVPYEEKKRQANGDVYPFSSEKIQ